MVNLPLRAGGNMSTGLGLRPGTSLGWQIDLNGVSAGYFSTLGIPVLRGRDFTPQETADERRPVVILNATAARRLWPGEEPLGKQVTLDWDEPDSPGRWSAWSATCGRSAPRPRRTPRPISPTPSSSSAPPA
jgi:hypothetical protein